MICISIVDDLLLRMLHAIPESIQLKIVSQFRHEFDKEIKLSDFHFTSGGCINNTGILNTDIGEFFIKWNSKSRFPDMFELEKKGLQILSEAEHDLKIPKGYFCASDEQHVFILMESIKSGQRKPDYWEVLGRGLADLHSNTSGYFGLDHNNYIGSLEQSNIPNSSWQAFFAEERLRKPFKKAFDKGLLTKSDSQNLESLINNLNSNIPENCPVSLLHGDLWSGNLMVDEKGNPALIDPAIYYGFREMEIAFTELFGRFGSDFYSSYIETWPLETGFNSRKDIWNLYPILVHVNLFGGSYVSSARSILNHYS